MKLKLHMTITITFKKSCKYPLPTMFLGSKHLCQVVVYNYFRHHISNNLLDDKDVTRQTPINYFKGNMLCKCFKNCSNVVKCFFYLSQRCIHYMTLWCNHSQFVFIKLVFLYYNVCRL